MNHYLKLKQGFTNYAISKTAIDSIDFVSSFRFRSSNQNYMISRYMFKYSNSIEPIMCQVLTIMLFGLLVLGIIGNSATVTVNDLYATKSTSIESSVQPERGSQQATEATGSTTLQAESKSLIDSQQLENEIEAAIQEKDEQIRDVLQVDKEEEEEENDDFDNNGNENDDDNNGELDDQIEIDKKAPIAVSGKNVYIVWFNDQNTPKNNSEILFRYSNDSGVTYSDKMNLSNTTNSDSVDAMIAAEGDKVIITWWERNQTNNEPVVRVSSDNGNTFGPLLKLATEGPVG